MSHDQIIVFTVLGFLLVLFIWGRIRYDIVALMGLLALVLSHIIPAKDAFNGFASSATITVAVVLIISRGLSNSGAIDMLASIVAPAVKRVSLHIASLSGTAAVLSSLMNNVGALALLMPVAIESSEKAKRSPAFVLMPLSFASILGGMVTLIGTPPNILISDYRQVKTGEAFKMFDYSPVGGIIALVGVAFVAFIGWHLIPNERRKQTAGTELFKIDDYLAEVLVPKDSDWIDKSVLEVQAVAEKNDAEIVGLIRGKRRILASVMSETIQFADVLIIEAGSNELTKFMAETKLELVGQDHQKSKLLSSDDTAVIEAVVQSRSRMEGRSPHSLKLKNYYGVNLLAVSRQGKRIQNRLRLFKFQAGDILLLQGDSGRFPEIMGRLGCLPLAKRTLKIGTTSKAGLAVFLFASAIIASIFSEYPLLIPFSIAAVAMVLFNIIPLGDIYESVDWPIIMLLGAMIPVGGALESTGATGLIAKWIVSTAEGAPLWAVLALVLVVSMTLSDIMNNAATVLVMAPIGYGIAESLSLSPDPFLMAVAVGASCAFLTPIGHQNNTLIMGPGGYQFGDYWRMGLPLEILIVVLSVPLIIFFWPLSL
jgi:di/tricarboxylate transporter